MACDTRSPPKEPTRNKEDKMQIEEYIIATASRLVDLAREGDTVAFEQLFQRYRPAIRQLYLQRTSGNDADTDDLLQETFVKVYLNLARYDPTYTFGQWIYTIARNAFIDFLRKRHGEVSLEALPGSSYLVPAALEPTPEERVIRAQQHTRLMELLERLSPRYRRLVELRFLSEYSYEEISAELGLPMGTVKTQIHRAREQLCRLISQQSD